MEESASVTGRTNAGGKALHIAALQQGFTGQTNSLGILFQCFFSDSSFQILIEFKDYSQLATVQYV